MLALITSVLAAVIPTGVYVLLLWRLDRYEHEPLLLFFAAFFWGAVPAVITSLIAEVMADLMVGSVSSSYEIGAALIEEVSKGAALLLVYWLFHSEFDGVLDGIIYGSAIGFGFAMTENIIYYIGALSKGGIVEFTGLILVRGVAFGLNHAMYSAIVGAALGYARFRKRISLRWLVFLLGLGTAVFIHTLHNALVTNQQACLLSLLTDWSGVLALVVTVILCWRYERHITTRYLNEEVSLGTITQAQYEALSRVRRIAARGRSQKKTNQQQQIQRSIDQIATELAFKKHQVARMGDEGGNNRIIDELRSQLQDLNKALIASL